VFAVAGDLRSLDDHGRLAWHRSYDEVCYFRARGGCVYTGGNEVCRVSAASGDVVASRRWDFPLDVIATTESFVVYAGAVPTPGFASPVLGSQQDHRLFGLQAENLQDGWEFSDPLGSLA
jgi:hypothetical protein